ncbi:heavy metal-associated isoprenylated plant protein 35 [Dendrobium catenatum]|uniref:Heavy metal-associated isoprenylated plant protein 26 n=1 Tax=Dendrobium catenatum TaxID=906689 RepID=A0A2I0VJX5_9ASPA|nr:heavy metal-associated isoprenylated plant protein 35 [Dendrobium catenatum]PKU63718.1 Heavy metal-associated isoprenylated plant protein 26 [Dendrobium catenatum]
MASGPEGTEPLSYQTSVLKVSIHCEGCKKKVRKILQRLDGVYDIDINSKQNKVTVTGKVDAESLIRRLVKYGKHAELWPEKKADAANSSGEAAIDTKAKVASATAVPKTERKLPNTEKQQQTEEDKNKTTPPPTTEAKPTDSAAAAASAAMSGAFSASEPNTDAPKPNEMPENSDKKDSDKPAPAAVENGSSEEADDLKKKGKKAQSETSSIDEGAVADTAKLGNASAAAISPPKPKQFPAYPQPIYSVSYSAVQPSTSHAYYTSSPAAMPSSYTYSGYPPENYSLDPYYGSMEAPAASGGSYDMFNDENPNACNLM